MPESSSTPLPLTRRSVLIANDAIRPSINTTPLLSFEALSAALPGNNTLLFKAENLQNGGSFKFRGATFSLSRLTEEQLSKGVCTHSSGNHAAALALAAQQKGIKCFVVMPDNAAQSKIAAVKKCGAEITFCEPNIHSRVAALASVQNRTGATMIHPHDAVNTILGQGTVFVELLDQVDEPLAAVIAPVGGGGLIAGIALAAEGTGVRVFGAEPAGADDCAQGLKEGRRREDVNANTIADGLRTPVGTINFPIIQQKVESVIVVSDEEIVAAMHKLWDRKLLVEPSGAVAYAAACSPSFQDLGIKGPVAIILSGGNVDLSKPLPWEQSLSSNVISPVEPSE